MITIKIWFIFENLFNSLINKIINWIGQCGIGPNNRSNSPPYFENRIRKPEKVSNIPQIKKIVAGTNHTLALSSNMI